jgi:hypothetical protein
MLRALCAPLFEARGRPLFEARSRPLFEARGRPRDKLSMKAQR